MFVCSVILLPPALVPWLPLRFVVSPLCFLPGSGDWKGSQRLRHIGTTIPENFFEISCQLPSWSPGTHEKCWLLKTAAFLEEQFWTPFDPRVAVGRQGTVELATVRACPCRKGKLCTSGLLCEGGSFLSWLFRRGRLLVVVVVAFAHIGNSLRSQNHTMKQITTWKTIKKSQGLIDSMALSCYKNM